MSHQAAVVGCGNAGTVHVEVLKDHPKTSVEAVVDPNDHRRNAIVEQFGTSGYESIDSLLSDRNPDIIHVCSPVQTHVSISVKTIAQGIPTLIEKPVAASVDDVEQIIATREAHDVPVGTVHNRLYNSRMIEAKKRVENGEIGEVIALDLLSSTEVDLTNPPRGDWVFDLPGGQLGETIPHHAYLVLAFADRLGDINGVTLQNYRDYQVVDFDGVSLTANDEDGDVLVTLRSLSNSSERYELNVYGTEGIMRIDLRYTPGIYLNQADGFSPKTVIKNYWNEGVQLSYNFTNLVLSKVRERIGEDVDSKQNHSGHYRIIDGFVDTVETSGEVPVTLEQGLDTIRFIDELERASVEMSK